MLIVQQVHKSIFLYFPQSKLIAYRLGASVFLAGIDINITSMILKETIGVGIDSYQSSCGVLRQL
jgi:hypothetical protein